jgi:hypothetical protein
MMEDPIEFMRRMMDDIRFWDQIQGDAKRTILCLPEQVDAVRAAIDQKDVGHLLTVRSSPLAPEGKFIIIDEQALEASWRQMIQRPIRLF